MEKSEQINELASALSKAQGAIKGALKDTANPFFKSKYADLSSVWEACREQLAANGLSVAQMPCESETGVMVETVLMHASGQWISNRFTMPVAKQDAQAVGSAITYSRRYALAAMVGVAPEDDDGNAATGNGDKIDRKTGEIKPSRLTPTTGAVDALNQEDQKKAHSGFSLRPLPLCDLCRECCCLSNGSPRAAEAHACSRRRDAHGCPRRTPRASSY